MANSTIMVGQSREQVDDQSHDRYPLLAVVVNNGNASKLGVEPLNSPERFSDPRQQESAVISATAISPDLWVTPQLRDRNPEAFASYSPEKERKLMHQAVVRIDESKMQTLKESLASANKLSRDSSSSPPLSEYDTTPASLSSTDYSHSKPTLLEGPKATLARLSEMLDERVFTGKQALIAIIASMCLPIIAFFVVQSVGFVGLIVAGIVGWIVYGSVRWLQNITAQPEPKETPMYLKNYGLMDPSKLKCMV